MHRFFVSQAEINLKLISLSTINHQLKNVLRIKKNDLIEIFDEIGCEYSVQISNDKCDQGEIISTINRKFQVYPEVILCQSFIKNDRFELILEKSSELGVNRIIPMITERVQGGSKLKTSDDKLLRWRKIIKEAVEQSGGNVIPKLESFATFKDLLESLDKKSEKILFWEKSVNSIEFKECLDSYENKIKQLVIFIGPVGGFSEGEISIAREMGCKIVTLGDRILKAETVAISSISIIRYHFQGLISGKDLS